METIPFHIYEISRLYPVLASADGNIAEGEIQLWNAMFKQNKIDLPRPGSYVSIHAKYTLPRPIYTSVNPILHEHTTYVDYGEVWVHLSNGYFKQVLKRKLK
jgi:hypothetical protein